MKEVHNTMLEILHQSPVIPVVVVEKVEEAVPIARALHKGGLNVIEVALRSEAAMEAVLQILKEIPEMVVGVGTVLHAEQMDKLHEMGVHFIVTPGITPRILAKAKAIDLPLLPGIANVSDIMLGLENGVELFKFFPAEASGGTKVLKAFYGPLPHVRFCPTGGITPDNMSEYLSLPNVVAVGGSWLVSKDDIKHQRWDKITEKVRLLEKHMNSSSPRYE